VILTIYYSRYSASIILKVVYGYETLGKDDPMLGIMEDFFDDLATATKPGYLIEVFHWCMFHADFYTPER